VVEAGRGRGAIITADHAAKQGRDVFAFPGDVDNKFYAGTNELISEGAKMVRGARDVLAEYAGLWHKRIFTENISKNKYYVGAEIPPAAPLGVEEYSEEASKKKSIFSSFRKKSHARKGISEQELARAKEEAENREVYEEVIDLPEGNGTYAETPAELEGFERDVYEAMEGACACDEIAAALQRKTGQSADVGKVLSALTTLEIDGYCRSLPGGIFKKI
jgi:predicted Rossmann fold nucleotide-binding protein DprA/Smf involved in DNA uptake